MGRDCSDSRAVQMAMRLALSSVAPVYTASVTEHEAGTVFEALLASCPAADQIALADKWVSHVHAWLFESDGQSGGA